jgi:DNA recombination protein RmuC
MTNILLIILIILAIVILIAIFTKKPKELIKDDTGLQLILTQMNELNRTLDQKTHIIDQKINESQKEASENFKYQSTESQKLLREITEQVSKNLLDVAREQTKTNEATKDFVLIAQQLGNLEKVLKHQKQRGNLGEASLELILSNILPPSAYQMQYEFKDKTKVDAIIMTKDGIIPIDAKFSLDNYERLINVIDEKQKEALEKEFKNDLKKRIDETSQYIKPTEGTLSFAFMFIPAEAIYYDLLVNEIGSVKVNTRNLIDYAYNEKKVIIVSPTTFSAYLQSVLYGFKAFKIEEKAKDIIKNVDTLGKHIKAYEEYHNKMGKSLSAVFNHYKSSSGELKKIDKDVTRITDISPELDILQMKYSMHFQQEN